MLGFSTAAGSQWFQRDLSCIKAFLKLLHQGVQNSCPEIPREHEWNQQTCKTRDQSIKLFISMCYWLNCSYFPFHLLFTSFLWTVHPHAPFAPLRPSGWMCVWLWSRVVWGRIWTAGGLGLSPRLSLPQSVESLRWLGVKRWHPSRKSVCLQMCRQSPARLEELGEAHRYWLLPCVLQGVRVSGGKRA